MGVLALFRSWKLINYFREADGKEDIGLWPAWKELVAMKPINTVLLNVYVIPIKERKNESASHSQKRKAINMTTMLVYFLVICLIFIEVLN